MAPDRRQQRERREAAGEWLRRTRKQRGFATMGAFARRLGVHESLISRYETGMSEVPDDRAEQIADALGMDILEVRRGLGLWVPDDSARDDATDTLPSPDDLPDDPDELVKLARRFLDDSREHRRRSEELYSRAEEILRRLSGADESANRDAS